MVVVLSAKVIKHYATSHAYLACGSGMRKTDVVTYVAEVVNDSYTAEMAECLLWCPLNVYTVCECRYEVKLMRNDSDWLVNSGTTETLAVGNAAVMTVVIESNETNVSSARFLM